MKKTLYYSLLFVILLANTLLLHSTEKKEKLLKFYGSVKSEFFRGDSKISDLYQNAGFKDINDLIESVNLLAKDDDIKTASKEIKLLIEIKNGEIEELAYLLPHPGREDAILALESLKAWILSDSMELEIQREKEFTDSPYGVIENKLLAYAIENDFSDLNELNHKLIKLIETDEIVADLASEIEELILNKMQESDVFGQTELANETSPDKIDNPLTDDEAKKYESFLIELDSWMKTKEFNKFFDDILEKISSEEEFDENIESKIETKLLEFARNNGFESMDEVNDFSSRLVSQKEIVKFDKEVSEKFLSVVQPVFETLLKKMTDEISNLSQENSVEETDPFFNEETDELSEEEAEIMLQEFSKELDDYIALKSETIARNEYLEVDWGSFMITIANKSAELHYFQHILNEDQKIRFINLQKKFLNLSK